VTREVQSLLVLMVGVVTLRLAATDAYLNYVKSGMRPWLLISGALLVLLAVALLWRALIGSREERHADDHAGLRAAPAHGEPEAPDGEAHHDHDHSNGPKVAWLLLLPVLAVFVVPIDPLGSFAAARQGARPLELEQKAQYPPLPRPSGGAVDLPMLEFIDRAFYDTEQSLRGVPVRMVGFVAPAGDRDADFLLSRFIVSCCAADAMPVQIAVRGVDGAPPPVDSWVEVVGEWEPWDGEPDASDFVPNLTARRVTPVEQPADPYATFGS